MLIISATHTDPDKGSPEQKTFVLVLHTGCASFSKSLTPTHADPDRHIGPRATSTLGKYKSVGVSSKSPSSSLIDILLTTFRNYPAVTPLSFNRLFFNLENCSKIRVCHAAFKSRREEEKRRNKEGARNVAWLFPLGQEFPSGSRRRPLS